MTKASASCSLSRTGEGWGEGDKENWLLSQQFEHLLRRARKHCFLPSDNNRSLHQHRMLQEQVDNRRVGHVLVRIETECLKIFVLADEISRRIW